MAETFSIRFRPVAGSDLGPFSFQDSATVQQIKEKILAEWPKEGPLAKEPPQQVADIKLILSGKFLDAAKLLKEYRSSMGEVQPDTVVTMHVVVRPSAAPSTKKQPGTTQGQPKEEEQSQGCGCVIC